jgi:transposase
VFAGNRNDATTVEEIVEAMEKKYGRASRVWVMDRGMTSEDNLRFLRQRGGRYIVGTPKAMLRQFEEYLTRHDWQEVQPGVEVQLAPGPDGEETFVLARSADRREKEKAMHDRFAQRLQTALEKMQASAAAGRLHDEAVANRRVGRLLAQYWRAAKAFDLKIERLSPPEGKARLRITWTRNARWSDWAALSEGCYLLRTNLTDTDPATLWKRYIQLTEAEWAFRITKDELEIRPIWHQKEERVLGHILVCFLAYVLWKTLAQWMRRSGLGDAPRTVMQELAKLQSGDVVLPTKGRQGQDHGTIRLRCVTEPDEAQKVLLHRLGLALPRRLRRTDQITPM